MKWLLDSLTNPLVRAVAIVVVSALVVALLVRIIRSAVRTRVSDSDVRYRASKIVSVAGYLVVIAVIVAQVGWQFSGLTVAIGAAGAGIAFALQEVIASMAGWLAVALGGYYKVGDRVQLGGIKGDVIDIGVLRTTLMEIGSWVNGDLYNGRMVRVANSFVFKEPVFNYSGEFPFVWDEIVVPIKYGSDYDAARSILDDAAKAVLGGYIESARARWSELVRVYRIEDARIDPCVTIVANDNWVEFTLRYVVDHRARRSTKDELFTRLLRAVEGSHGRVALASMTVQLVGAPALRVSLEHASEPRSVGPKGE